MSQEDVLDHNSKLLRYKPYFYSFDCTVKGRWQDRTVLDVFTKEFTDRSEVYYKIAIKLGIIKVNGQIADIGTILKNGDRISHLIHYHEPPVVLEASSITIIYHDSELLVVNKPGSVPVHPTGRYRHNSLIELLKIQYPELLSNRPSLNAINRLDRLTSGVCMLAITQKKAEEMHALMREKEGFRKEYIARVYGVFPTVYQECTNYMAWADHIHPSNNNNNNKEEEIQCTIPLAISNEKHGAVVADVIHGKESVTFFTFLATNGQESLVHCRPITGRTHQIRVHLSLLGYPIVYDPLYGAQAIHRNHPIGTQSGQIVHPRHRHHSNNINNSNSNNNNDDAASAEEEGQFEEVANEEEFVLKHCAQCVDPISDPIYPQDCCLCLHAYRYATPQNNVWEALPWPWWATELMESPSPLSER